VVILDAETCEIGQKVASQFHLHVSGVLKLKAGETEHSCVISQIRGFGGAEDSQIFLPMKNSSASRWAAAASQLDPGSRARRPGSDRALSKRSSVSIP